MRSVVALDAHCHADLLLKNEPQFTQCYRKERLAGISWSYLEDIHSWKDYPAYWQGLNRMCQSLTGEGVPFFYMVGIHPRAIPPDLERLDKLPEELAASLQNHFAQPLCLGLGELGLDHGSALEERILRWQLDWASQCRLGNKRIGIHTPRQNKHSITQAALRLLMGYSSLRDRILIDHVNTQTLPWVREEGYMMGVTLQPVKTSVAELCQWMENEPELSSRIILNSDGAMNLSSTYLEFIERKELCEQSARKALLLENALRFFSIIIPEEMRSD